MRNMFSKEALEELKGPFDSFDHSISVLGGKLRSAWLMVSPQRGVSCINVIEGSDPAAVKRLLQDSAQDVGTSVTCVDVAAGIGKYGSAFIRGQIFFNSDGTSYDRGKQPWLAEPGIYIFENHDTLISSPDSLLELLRGFYACRLAALDEGISQHDGTPMQNLSICFIVEKGQYRAFVEAHNRLRPPFGLIHRVEMTI